jgi:hypothetical protein
MELLVNSSCNFTNYSFGERDEDELSRFLLCWELTKILPVTYKTKPVIATPIITVLDCSAQQFFCAINIRKTPERVITNPDIIRYIP